MNHDLVAIWDAERRALDMLMCPFMLATPKTQHVFTGEQAANRWPGFAHLVSDPNAMYTDNEFMTDPRLVNAPNVLKQELILTTSANYSFNFAANSAPQAGLNGGAVFLNNIVLAKNNVAAIYGMRMRLGYQQGGATDGLNRRYQAFGMIPGDEYIFNSVGTLQVESETQVTNFDMDDFRDEPDFSPTKINKYDGMMLINPIRLVSGQLGILKFMLNTFNGATSTLVISSNAVIELSWFIVSGQASAGN